MFKGAFRGYITFWNKNKDNLKIENLNKLSNKIY